MRVLLKRLLKLAAIEDIIQKDVKNPPLDSHNVIAPMSETLLNDASPEDAILLKSALLKWTDKSKLPVSPDDELVENCV